MVLHLVPAQVAELYVYSLIVGYDESTDNSSESRKGISFASPLPPPTLSLLLSLSLSLSPHPPPSLSRCFPHLSPPLSLGPLFHICWPFSFLFFLRPSLVVTAVTVWPLSISRCKWIRVCTSSHCTGSALKLCALACPLHAICILSCHCHQTAH